MKRTVCISLAAVMLLLCSACSKQEMIDFGTFANRTAALGASCTILDYSVSKEQGSCCRTLFLSDRLVLRVFSDENGNLTQTRLFYVKMRKDGVFQEMDVQSHRLFMETAEWMIGAFCGESAEWSKEKLRALKLDDAASFQKTGELKLDFGSFYAVFYATAVESVLCVCNRFLQPMESTEKPESRPAFDATTLTRTETVPHK